MRINHNTNVLFLFFVRLFVWSFVWSLVCLFVFFVSLFFEHLCSDKYQNLVELHKQIKKKMSNMCRKSNDSWSWFFRHNVKHVQKVQWLFVVMFSIWFLPNQLARETTISTKISQNAITKISARSPMYAPKLQTHWFSDIWTAEAVFFFNMFRHTGFTESYVSLREQEETRPTSQNTYKPSF